MSQFSSLRGRGNYAYAGKVAADDALRSFIAARESSPDYGKLAEEAANIRSAEKIAAIKAQAQVAKTGIAVKGNLRATEIRTEAAADYKSNVRKAGLLSAAGQLGGMGMMGYGEERIKNRDSSDLIDRYNNRIEDLTTKAQEIRDGITTTFGNDSAGKVDGPVSSAEAMQVTGYTAPEGQKIFSVPEMQNLLMNAGMSKENARILSAVGMGESSGRASIDTVQSGLDPTKSNEYSIGLWQINAPVHMDKLERRGYTVEDLRDPQKNANIAVDIFNEVNSFSPWTVYDDNKYQQYLID
mgnify:CR=1 FL=1